MSCGALQGGLFTNCQEWRFHPSKQSEMSRAILPEGRYAQESRFQGAKRWNMGNAVQQLGWFAGAQESRILVAKYSETGSVIPQGGWLADAVELRIQVEQLQVRVVPT